MENNYDEIRHRYVAGVFCGSDDEHYFFSSLTANGCVLYGRRVRFLKEWFECAPDREVLYTFKFSTPQIITIETLMPQPIEIKTYKN